MFIFLRMSIVLSLLLISCEIQDDKIVGNIYSLNGECSDWSEIYVNGIRVNELYGDTMNITLRTGNEIFMNYRMIKNVRENSYEAVEPIYFYPKNESRIKSQLKIHVKDHSSLDVFITTNGEKEDLKFIKTYNTEIDLDKVNDVFYAEDGFGLCPNEYHRLKNMK